LGEFCYPIYWNSWARCCDAHADRTETHDRSTQL